MAKDTTARGIRNEMVPKLEKIRIATGKRSQAAVIDQLIAEKFQALGLQDEVQP